MRSPLIALCFLAPVIAQEPGARSTASHRPHPTQVPTSATDPTTARLRATEAALAGDFSAAETHQLAALAACKPCPPADRAILRAELATYYLHAGFPQAAVAQWRHALAELGPDHPYAAPAQVGLAAALHAAGKTAEARAIWTAVCPSPHLTRFEAAACRFNLQPEWSEVELLLPILLDSPHPLARLTVLLTAADAAPPARAAALRREAQRIADTELGPRHPLRARIKPGNKPKNSPKDKPTVSLSELKEKPRH